MKSNWLVVLQQELNVEDFSFSKIPENYSKAVESITKFGFEFSLPLDNTENLKVLWIQSDLSRTMQFLRKKANLGIDLVAQVYLEYDEENFPLHFLTTDFRHKLKSDVFVTLSKNLISKNSIVKYPVYSKRVEFQGNIVDVHLTYTHS